MTVALKEETIPLSSVEHREQMATARALMARVPARFYPRNNYLYHAERCLIIMLEWYMKRHQTLTGASNLARVAELRRQGCKIVMDFDHFSAADIPAPLAVFRNRGFNELTKNIFYLIGLRWSEKFWIRGGDRSFVVPMPLVPNRPVHDPLEHEAAFKVRREEYVKLLRQIHDYNNKALDLMAAQLREGKMGWVSSQGTRSRSGLIQRSVSGAQDFWRAADVVVPIGLEGTRDIIPIYQRFPRIWKELRVLVGKPIFTVDGLPSADALGRARAQLHIDHGNPLVAGEYYEELTGRPLQLLLKTTA